MAKNQELKNLINKVKCNKDLTQAEISTLIGVGKTYLSDMVNGRVPFTENIKEKLKSLLEQNSTIIGNENIIGNIKSTIDARKYYSDSPDVLKQQIDEIERLLKEKEERIKEKDAQIKEKDAQIKDLLAILKQK